jgi:hypothetical protein
MCVLRGPCTEFSGLMVPHPAAGATGPGDRGSRRLVRALLAAVWRAGPCRTGQDHPSWRIADTPQDVAVCRTGHDGPPAYRSTTWNCALL